MKYLTLLALSEQRQEDGLLAHWHFQMQSLTKAFGMGWLFVTYLLQQVRSLVSYNVNVKLILWEKSQWIFFPSVAVHISEAVDVLILREQPLG